MQRYYILLFSSLFLCASAFPQSAGIIQCDSDTVTSVPAWVAPGKPQVVEQLSCGQIVSVVEKGGFFAVSQYSSRPLEYVKIEIGDTVAYVDAKYVNMSGTLELSSPVEDEPPAIEEPNAAELEEEKKWNTITKDDVKLLDERLRRPIYLNGPRTFTATVINSSEFSLAQIRLLVRLYDCSGRPLGNYSNCEIIGEVKPVVEAPIPAGQTRRLTVSLIFSATPPVRGTYAWSYEVLGVRVK
jgi:hypothetical protein